MTAELDKVYKLWDEYSEAYDSFHVRRDILIMHDYMNARLLLSGLGVEFDPMGKTATYKKCILLTTEQPNEK